MNELEKILDEGFCQHYGYFFPTEPRAIIKPEEYKELLSELTFAIKALLKKEMPAAQHCKCSSHNKDCDCTEFFGYNSYRKEMLKVLDKVFK